MMRAARRDRPQSGGPKADASPNPQPPDQVADTTPRDRPAAEPPAAADPAPTPVAAATAVSLPTIDERRPEKPLSAEQRRARAHKNLTAIAGAIIAFYDKHNQFPKTYSQTPGGLKGLSWRVELLPFLGYEALYEQFDFSKPWNVEPNKSLLSSIPPEYVSPERFDTKTNFLLPAHRNFLFAANQSRVRSQVEDGLENTILLIEAADSQAVPWTQPEDFSPQDDTDFRDELNGPREDGAFAVWANGLPVLLAKDLSAKQLRDAFTYESGDGQLAGAVHQDILLTRPSGSDEVDAVATASPPALRAGDGARETPRSEHGPAGAAAFSRQPVPVAGELIRAQQRLREIFADQLRDAQSPDARLALARDMVQHAREMPQDPVGAYALQTAAMRLASGAGGLDVLLQAIQSRGEQFKVDPYEIETTALLEFGQQAVQPRHRRNSRSSRAGIAYAERAVTILHQAVLRDDYDRAIQLAGYAARLTEEAPADGLSQSFTRLRAMLETSRSRYADMSRQVAAFRQDASDSAAAAEVGRFLCFIKGDWQQGLPLLCQHAPSELRRVSELDLRDADQPSAQVATGDAWWQFAEQGTGPTDRQGALDRAAHWYRRALDRLPESLDKIHAQARLREIDKSDPATPLAAARRIAATLRIDLQTGQTTPATRGAADRRK